MPALSISRYLLFHFASRRAVILKILAGRMNAGWFSGEIYRASVLYHSGAGTAAIFYPRDQSRGTIMETAAGSSSNVNSAPLIQPEMVDVVVGNRDGRAARTVYRKIRPVGFPIRILG